MATPSHVGKEATEDVPFKVIGHNNGGNYTERRSARALVINSKGEFILIYASKEDYFKLPGGGLENDEDHHTACEREVMEETGCKIALDPDLVATAEEWRGHLHQVSFCYTAKLLEDTGHVSLTEEEIEDGLKHQWVGFKDAIQLMKRANPTSDFGKSVKERDLFFVETYLRFSNPG